MGRDEIDENEEGRIRFAARQAALEQSVGGVLSRNVVPHAGTPRLVVGLETLAEP